MPTLDFFLALILLLGTPGPTNTLLSLAGAATGFWRSLPLLIGEVAGYLTVVVPVTLLAAPWLAAHPSVSLLLKLVACLWVLWLARGLWISGGAGATARAQVTVGQVFVTTLLNPKALVIALALMPHETPERLLPWFLGLAAIIPAAGSLWILLGAGMGRIPADFARPARLARFASLCLVGFAALIAWRALSA